jgi:hypothetical protein
MPQTLFKQIHSCKKKFLCYSNVFGYEGRSCDFLLLLNIPACHLKETTMKGVNI